MRRALRRAEGWLLDRPALVYPLAHVVATLAIVAPATFVMWVSGVDGWLTYGAAGGGAMLGSMFVAARAPRHKACGLHRVDMSK